MESALAQFLSNGADMATIGMLIIFWRFDKRLSRLEYWQEQIQALLLESSRSKKR